MQQQNASVFVPVFFSRFRSFLRALRRVGVAAFAPVLARTARSESITIQGGTQIKSPRGDSLFCSEPIYLVDSLE